MNLQFLGPKVPMISLSSIVRCQLSAFSVFIPGEIATWICHCSLVSTLQRTKVENRILAVLRIFLIQLFPNWTACRPITYNNSIVNLWNSICNVAPPNTCSLSSVSTIKRVSKYM